MRKLMMILTMGVLLLSVSCQTMTSSMKGSMEIQPVSVKLVDLSNLFTSPDAIVVDMLFGISNPNPYPVNVTQLEWAVSIQKIRLGTLAIPEGIYIPAKKEAQVRKTYFLNPKTGPASLFMAGNVINLKVGAEIFGGISKAITEDKAVWNLDGAAFVDSEKGSSSTTFTAEWEQAPAPE